MGFFKKLGSKLKRVISLKNVTRAVTGQFGAIGKDVLRVATTNSPAENRALKAAAEAKGQVYVPPPVKTVEIPSPVESYLNAQGAKFSANAAKELGKTEVAQDLTSFATKAALQAFWEKNKSWLYWVIGLIFALIMFLTFRWAFRSAKGGKSRR